MNLVLWQARFSEHLKDRNSGNRTIECYVGELKPFFAVLEALGIDSLGRIRRGDIEEYRSHLRRVIHRGNPLAASTQAYRLSAVKAFMRYLARERYIVFDAAASVELPRVGKTLPRAPLSIAEVSRFLDRCTGDTPLEIRNRAMIEVIYSTAVRNTELCTLKLQSLDLQQRQLSVIGKGDKTRVVPLGDEALRRLQRYLDQARPHLVRAEAERTVFLSQRGRPMQRGPLAKLVGELGRRAGLKKPVTPHLLRNCCLTHMLHHGAEIRHLQEMAGHASPETTQRYTRVEVTNLRRVLERCHPRERRRT